jgi:hypothetical protein
MCRDDEGDVVRVDPFCAERIEHDAVTEWPQPPLTDTAVDQHQTFVALYEKAENPGFHLVFGIGIELSLPLISWSKRDEVSGGVAPGGVANGGDFDVADLQGGHGRNTSQVLSV